MGKPAEAETQFRRALELAPGSVEVVDQLVTVLGQRNRREEAVQLIRGQIEKTDRPAPFHHLLGTVYMAMGDTANAETNFKRAIDLDKNLLPAYEALGQLYTRAGAAEKAIAQYRAMAAAAPKNPTPHLFLGMAYEAQKRDDEAIAEYERALELAPRFAPAANNLAYLYAERGKNIDVALSLAQTAMEQLPNDPGVADTLGWIYYKKGIYQKAIGLLRDSAEKLPENASVRYHLGMAYYRNGDRDNAKRELTKGLRLDAAAPWASEAKHTLAELAAPASPVR
jgi:Flp pilus assembly protein TadD